MAIPTELSAWDGRPETLAHALVQDSYTVPLMIGALRELQLELQADPTRMRLRSVWESVAWALTTELADLLPFYEGKASAAAMTCYALTPPTKENWAKAAEANPDGTALLRALWDAWGIWEALR